MSALFMLLASSTPAPVAAPAVPVWAYIIGVLGVGGMVGAVITYFTRRRETSGRINTTEAAKLWDEAGVIRNELRDEVVQLRADKDALSGKVDLLNAQMETMRDKHAECTKNEALLKIRVEQLEASMERRKAAPRKTAPRNRA